MAHPPRCSGVWRSTEETAAAAAAAAFLLLLPIHLPTDGTTNHMAPSSLHTLLSTQSIHRCASALPRPPCRVMAEHGFHAPAGWPGYRELTEK